MECVLLIGIPASGKSSFYAQRFATTHLRLNLDMLRTRHREAELLATCLRLQQPFVVDNTNVAAVERARFLVPARAAGFRTVGFYLASKLDECLPRNAGRTGAARVPTSPCATWRGGSSCRRRAKDSTRCTTCAWRTAASSSRIGAMKFDELDARMRVFETAHDHCALPGLFLVARLDGRGFTRLTKEVLPLEVPFDVTFRDTMIATVEHLMQCGVDCVFGYSQSDEISLLLHPATQAFHRKERKLISVLAGEASAVASLRFQRAVAFDRRISQLPTQALVVDYFRWRQEDAGRNALNAHCYWLLRREGVTPEGANDRLAGMSVAQKNEFLFQRGVNFDRVPAWQKRGVVVAWRNVEVEGRDPRTDTVVKTTRRRLLVDAELPFGDAYSGYVAERLGA